MHFFPFFEEKETVSNEKLITFRLLDFRIILKICLSQKVGLM